MYVLSHKEMNDERSVAIPMKIAIAMITKKKYDTIGIVLFLFEEICFYFEILNFTISLRVLPFIFKKYIPLE